MEVLNIQTALPLVAAVLLSSLPVSAQTGFYVEVGASYHNALFISKRIWIK